MKKPPRRKKNKPPYSPPKLESYGKVTDLTRGMAGTKVEGKSGRLGSQKGGRR